MKIVLAFSGGLDTSFLVPYLAEKYQTDVVTATVNTGGFNSEDLAAIEERALSLGAVQHITVDAVDELFDDYLSHLIRGNVLKGGIYPLCVAAERTIQAGKVAEQAIALKAEAVAHGATGAGNDGVRFDVTFRVVAPSLRIIAPVRDEGWTRGREIEYLKERGHAVEEQRLDLSVNEGIWGTTLGGGWTHDPWTGPDEDAFAAFDVEPEPQGASEISIGFEEGLPVSIESERVGGVEALRRLNRIGRTWRVGRGIHLGDTVLGIKGRIAFEAPAPLMIVSAHRELEKLVLTGNQMIIKDQLTAWYGKWVHEGLYFEPALRDIEALFASSQQRVTGRVRIRLEPGRFSVVGTQSPHSLIDEDIARYGEENSLWDGRDARGFSTLLAIPSLLHRSAGERSGAHERSRAQGRSKE